MKKKFIDNNIIFKQFSYLNHIYNYDVNNQKLRIYNNTNRNLQKNILKNDNPLNLEPSQPSRIHIFLREKDKLINQKQQFTDIEIESGLDFLVSHFEEPLYPRKISTFKSNNKQFNYALTNSLKKQIPPMSIITLKTNYKDLYYLLEQKERTDIKK